MRAASGQFRSGGLSFPDTGVVPSSSLDAVREAVHAGELEQLLGLAECAWLDVKRDVYALDRPYGAEELLKDVAAFANAPAGGLLLVGFSTRLENGQEIIDQVRPVPHAAVDLDRHRKLLDRIIPVPMYVAVDWIDCGDGKGILAIDVPAQPPASLPYVVPGLFANPAKYSWMNLALKSVLGYLATISFRNCEGNLS